MSYISENDRSFIKEILSTITGKTDLDFLINGYMHTEGFHRLFKLSLLKIKETKAVGLLNSLIDALNSDYSRYLDVITELELILFLIHKIEHYENLIESYKSKVYVEDIFIAQEKARKRAVTKGLTINNESASEPILSSMLAKMADSMTVLSKLESEAVISFGDKRSVSEKNYYSVLTYIGLIDSLKGFLTEHLRDTYNVINRSDLPSAFLNPPEGKEIPEYLIVLKESQWRQLERYRDLSFDYIFYYERQKKYEALFNSGAGNYDNENDILHIDFAKEREYYTHSQYESIKGKLLLIYGDLDKKYTFRGYTFSINDLLKLAFKIIHASGMKDDENLKMKNKGSDFYIVGGRKSFSRKVNLDDRDMELLDLLCFDFDDSDLPAYNIQYSLVFKRHEVYSIVPNWINHISIEKIIDKLMSKKEVRSDGVRIQKGDFFEEQVIEMLQRAGLDVGHIKKDSSKNVPQVDGIFVYGDYFFFYEAKASIHPNSRIEAFNYMDSVVSEAVEQLNVRKKYFENNPGDAESRLGFSIDGKIHVPMILTTSHYWNGYYDLVLNDSSKVLITDFETLSFIILNKKAPVWRYSEKKEKYCLSYTHLASSLEVYNYLANPCACLNGEPVPLYQIGEHGIAFEVYKHINADIG